VIDRTVERILELVGRLLWHARLAPLVRRIGRNNPKVILYHACEPRESAFTRRLGVTITPDDFAAQLDFLASQYDVVAVDELATSTPPPGAAAITFDDGYRSVLDHAAPLLEARGMPATVYLVTDVVGNDDLVWVNELNWLLDQHPVPTGPVVARVLGLPVGAGSGTVVAAVLERYRPELVRRLLDELWAVVPATRADVLADLDLYLTWDEVRALEERRISFGSHTATHPNLRGLQPAEVDDELERSTAAMERELGACRSFAYPFGFTDDAVTAEVESRGFSSVMIVGGTNYGARPLRMARVGLEGTDPASLFAQLEVVSPAKAALRSLKARVRGRAVA
jgi:peptidoglycan/xylan/chitin deacetylase (PgdA/CDA1 family)